MKRTILFFALSAFAMTLSARQPSRLARLSAANPASLVFSSVEPDLPARLLAQVHARRVARPKGVRVSAITDSISARAFIIPAAGSVAGAGGLFFKSDVTLVNYRDTPQQVVVGFWKQGTTNTLNLSTYKSVTLPAGQYVTVQDFVGTSLTSSGLGSLVFLPYTGTTLDDNSAIDGFSRIYTKQPGSAGTVSQPFDAIDPDTLSAQYVDEGVALGLRQDADFRTNFGIVNVDASQHIYKVSFVGEKLQTNVTVTIPPYGMIQQAIPAGDYGALQILYQVTDAPSNAFVSWIGYASSTDNITGDGWVSIASADFSPDELTLIGY
ncbi:MAG TPA: hypothetical protein VHX14_02055 [Thermoanaerobaculia bacterium]|jgi:hypothetical protein|nr:hypothetical protein [Thermoanaerobaculia bacterium]